MGMYLDIEQNWFLDFFNDLVPYFVLYGQLLRITWEHDGLLAIDPLTAAFSYISKNLTL